MSHAAVDVAASRLLWDTASQITTFTGQRYDVVNPTAAMVRVEDTAHHLSLICRFTGSIREFYSVAQHAYVGSLFCDQPFLFLHHDDTEAYVNDLCRPLKHHAEMAGYRAIEQRNWIAVAGHFDLPVDLPACVKDIDNKLVVTEARQLLPGAEAFPWVTTNPGLDYVIEPWPPAVAERMYLQRHHELAARR